MWKKLNGKKTVTSVALYMATALLALATGQSADSLITPETWTDFLTLGLGTLATILGGTGVAHKLAKGEVY